MKFRLDGCAPEWGIVVPLFGEAMSVVAIFLESGVSCTPSAGDTGEYFQVRKDLAHRDDEHIWSTHCRAAG